MGFFDDSSDEEATFEVKPKIVAPTPKDTGVVVPELVGKTFVVTEPLGVVVRAGFSMTATPQGKLRAGETIECLAAKVNDNGTTRVRFEGRLKGWVSLRSGDGSVLLEEAAAEPEVAPEPEVSRTTMPIARPRQQLEQEQEQTDATTEPAPFVPEVFRVVEQEGVKVRAGFDMASAAAGALRYDDRITSLETRVNSKGVTRIRFDQGFFQGWVSMTAGDGSVLLEKVELEAEPVAAAQTGDERRKKLRAQSAAKPDPVVYRVVEKGGVKVRAGYEMTSLPVGELRCDETFEALETRVIANGVTRIRFDQGFFEGWVSTTAGDGSVLLEQVVAKQNAGDNEQAQATLDTNDIAAVSEAWLSAASKAADMKRSMQTDPLAPDSGNDDAASVLSLGADDDGGWLDDVERFNKPLVAKVPKCMSCRTYVPYRLVKATHVRDLQAHGFLEWCSKCIKNTPNGKLLFEPGGLFGPPASSVPQPKLLPLKRVGEGASARPGVKPDANSALPASLQKMLLEEAWRADDSHTLTIAAGRGSITEVKRLLERKGDGLFDIDVDYRDPTGNTAMVCAAARGHTDVMAVLLEAGASVDSADDFGYTALHKSAKAGHTSCVTQLVKNGATVDTIVDAGSAGSQWTALHFASFEGHTSVARVLLEAGANVEAVNHYTVATHPTDRAIGRGLTALGCAVERGHTETAAALQQHADDSLASMMSQVMGLVKPALDERDAQIEARAAALNAEEKRKLQAILTFQCIARGKTGRKIAARKAEARDRALRAAAAAQAKREAEEKAAREKAEREAAAAAAAAKARAELEAKARAAEEARQAAIAKLAAAKAEAEAKKAEAAAKKLAEERAAQLAKQQELNRAGKVVAARKLAGEQVDEVDELMEELDDW